MFEGSSDSRALAPALTLDCRQEFHSSVTKSVSQRTGEVTIGGNLFTVVGLVRVAIMLKGIHAL